MANISDIITANLPKPFAARLSAGWFGVLHSLTGDLLVEGMSIALRQPWLLESESPDDVLPIVGNERGMSRYPGETAAQYRARLLDAWSAYRFAGAEQTIVSQFAYAGYPGTSITFNPAALGPNGEAAPYWSQFWIHFPYSSAHPVTGNGPLWGAFTYGDGSVYGIGVTVGFYQLIHGIIRKWKPSRWLCRGFTFELADTSIVPLSYGL